MKHTTQRIYLDYASSTPVSKTVQDAMEPYWREHFGNPGALHEEGRRAKEAVDEARAGIANILGSRDDEVIFTSGGTEANSLALKGVIGALEKEGRRLSDIHVITSAIEHPSLYATGKELEEKGARVSFIGVDSNGVLDTKALEEALCDETVLVSVMYANNEIGTIQPISEIGRIVSKFKKENNIETLYFHVDASQVPSYLDIRVGSLGVDLMSLDAQKIYGPKGVGVLYKKRGVKIEPLFVGGKQEGGMRSGTENVPLVVGMASALKEAMSSREKEVARTAPLRDFLIEEVLKRVPGASLNGGRENRIANNANFYIPNIDGEWLVTLLDVKGVAIGTKSSCQPLSVKHSHVIEALSGDKEHASHSFRFTLGRGTTKEELEEAVSILERAVKENSGQ